jgi:O-antigen ligase
LFFALLCARLLGAAFQGAYPTIWPTAALVAGSIGLGVWRPRATLFAFTFAMPLLSGLAQIGLLTCAIPISLVFSALWLGITAKSLWRRTVDGERWTVRWSDGIKVLVVTDLLITAVLTSLAVQIWRHHDSVEFWSVFRTRAILGYGDPYYFLASAFIWLQGLFYFRALCAKSDVLSSDVVRQGAKGPEQRAGSCDGGIVVSSDVLGNPELWRSKVRRAGGDGYETTVALHGLVSQGRSENKFNDIGNAIVLSDWLQTSFLIYAASLLLFAGLQWLGHLPNTFAFLYSDRLLNFKALTSPFEDIHSFGAIAVTVFIYLLAIWRPTPTLKGISILLGLTSLLVLIICSWSRATWLAGMAGVALIVCLRVSWKWRATIVVIGAVLLVATNQAAKTELWQKNAYLWRLGTLARFENPLAKDSNRMELYHKALGMIREKPLAGHGIGSFYLSSVYYARADDPLGIVPNFAHNFILQFAAELGVPAALLLVTLIVLALIQSYRCSLRVLRAPGNDLNLFGLTIALTTYLITQMTANALNIYPSNEYFFWFLMAALFTWPGIQPDKTSKPGSTNGVN